MACRDNLPGSKFDRLKWEMATTSTAPFIEEDFILPVLVLDWRIGKESCNVAKTRGDAFGCKANSRCVDFDGNVGGLPRTGMPRYGICIRISTSPPYGLWVV
ncbi:hypothetical protein SASPL_100225 [Salvia splendens]|uniref:Uncharacterized protein n=1 Tax=Salvia splendens TaxID=180675 RepID=A0A8X8YLY4_SALSN|nr:hypothetical protein SASPL_100225 [Salvia splendens]